MTKVDLLGPVGKLKIATKQAQLVELSKVINPAQIKIVKYFEECLEEKKRTRIITLKARQMGISTITEALGFHLSFAIPRLQALVLSHKSDSSQHILGMTRTFWETYWAKELYTAKNLAQKHLSWLETGSSFRIATAGNDDAGRSTTIQFFHGSEVAMWPKPYDLMEGLAQSIPEHWKSFMVMESTAKGRGNYFYNEWHAAVAGDTEFKPFFFPWWEHPEYTAEDIGWENSSLLNLDEEERTLQRYLGTKGLETAEIDSRLKWRRYTLRNKCGNDLQTLHQEYPSHPEEAFISTGTNVFPDEHLRACYEPMEGERGSLHRAGNRVEFTPDDTGELTIYARPSANLEWGEYVVFADPTRTSKTTSDLAVIQVLNRRTWEQVAVWRGRIDPPTLGDRLIELGLFYNTAMANCEVTGPGYGTIATLIAHNYQPLWEHRKFWSYTNYTQSRFGWDSSPQSKHAMIGFLKKALVERQIRIHDATTYKELIDYVVIDDGFGPADTENGYDDCVTSLGGALITVITTATELAPYNPGSRSEQPVRFKQTSGPTPTGMDDEGQYHTQLEGASAEILVSLKRDDPEEVRDHR